MERTIFIPQVPKNESKIPFKEVENSIEDEGIIIICDGNEIVGSVIFYDYLFYLGLKDNSDTYNSLSDILEDYPSFIFKYIT